jgi:WD40 repeat protein
MCSTLPRRWFSLLVALLIVLMDLMPLSATPLQTQFEVAVQADCLSCTLAKQFPVLHPQLQGEVEWEIRQQLIGKQTVVGLEATVASSNIHPPMGLKLQEQQAWMAMAMREQMHLFLPPTYNGITVVEQGKVRVEVQPLRVQSAKAERQGKTLVYKNAYSNTDSLQVIKQGQSEEFLYLRNSNSPKVFDYKVKVSQGVKIRSVEGSVAFVDSRGQGVRIERPWLVDSTGKRIETAVHWQILEGGKRLRLVVMPLGLRYPLVVDPSWTTTGSINTARVDHTATLLPNGKVLVTGGRGNGNNSLASAELYDPQAATWTTTGSMSTAREGHTATLLPNGKVLVTGGLGTSGSVSSAEVFDPQTGLWASTSSLNVARAVHTATLLPNGTILVAGGSTDRAAEIYDPSTESWTITGSLSVARSVHTATLLPDGTVLVAGGLGYDNGNYLSSSELYNPQTGIWSPAGLLNTARYFHRATLLKNGMVLVNGGANLGAAPLGGVLNSAELYDPVAGNWTVTAYMSNARAVHTATLLSNGTVLVAGGFLTNSTAEIYDPSTGVWSATASMNKARYYHTASLLPNSKVLVTGGTDSDGNYFSNAELYDLTSVSLSYYPLPSCRIVDTRNTASSNLPIGSPVTYTVNQGGATFDYSSQGGSASGCGIPTDAKAVFFNFVAVNAVGSGHLQAWPFGTSIPTASVLNYANAPGLNIANGIVLAVCDPSATTCSKDLNVQANQSTIKLVVDVVGYFK